MKKLKIENLKKKNLKNLKNIIIIFDENGINKFTNTKYDPKDFNKEGINKEGFDKEGLHKDTKNKYDPNGFDKYGKHKDNTFLNKEKNIRKDILRNIKWLEDRDKFLELYDKIIENGEIIINTENDTISLNVIKDFLEDLLSGNIKYNDWEHYEEDINDMEKKNNLTKNKESNKIKKYIKKKIIYYMEKIKKRLKPMK